MMLECIKQHLSNIWCWIHKVYKQPWGWVEEKYFSYKERVMPLLAVNYFHKTGLAYMCYRVVNTPLAFIISSEALQKGAKKA